MVRTSFHQQGKNVCIKHRGATKPGQHWQINSHGHYHNKGLNGGCLQEQQPWNVVRILCRTSFFESYDLSNNFAAVKQFKQHSMYLWMKKNWCQEIIAGHLTVWYIFDSRGKYQSGRYLLYSEFFRKSWTFWFIFHFLHCLHAIKDISIFIGPESDHWQCLSLTDSLTD